MNYVDGFVVPVPKQKRDEYLKFAQAMAPLFKEHGALRMVECWEDDVPDGKLTSFPMAVKREENEAIVFSWIVWPSREARDKGMAAFMADPRVPQDPTAMPFEGKRMIFGGFNVILDQ